MGKTHLLHAIGNKITEESPEKKVVCASSEKFTLDFISSIQKNRTVEFSKSYRIADVLLIDDIQFFQGKEQTQEQFFHTFNELFQSGKQIVMTADRYPGEMIGLQDRLLSRFKSGLSVDIQPPDFETRVAIVMEKAEVNGLKLPYDIIELIGTHIKKNVRDLESTIIRLLAHSSLSNREIDYGLAKKVIKERIGSDVKYVNNLDFKTTNNLYSMSAASSSINDDFVCVYSDLLFHKEILKNCIDSKSDACLMVEKKIKRTIFYPQLDSGYSSSSYSYGESSSK